MMICILFIMIAAAESEHVRRMFTQRAEKTKRRGSISGKSYDELVTNEWGLPGSITREELDEFIAGLTPAVRTADSPVAYDEQGDTVHIPVPTMVRIYNGDTELVRSVAQFMELHPFSRVCVGSFDERTA